jgi:hypothetical protein
MARHRPRPGGRYPLALGAFRYRQPVAICPERANWKARSSTEGWIEADKRLESLAAQVIEQDRRRLTRAALAFSTLLRR